MNVGTVSYATAALAFACLALLLRLSWTGGVQGRRFILAAAASALWATLIAYASWRGTRATAPLIFLGEMLRDGTWLFALAGTARGVLPRPLAMLATFLCPALVVLAALSAALLPDWTAGAVASRSIIVAGIVASVLVLLLLEQIFRNANATGRYGFKYLAIGLGGVYAYDLFVFSQADLYSAVAVEFWNARGLVNAALVPLIAISARRNPQWDLDVFVSRQAALFTTSVVAIGVYLLLMSLGGYYLQRIGGGWGMAATVVFVCGAVAVLAIIVMSESLRRRLRVFVHKHFYRNKYDYRVEWLRFVATLSMPEDGDVRRTSLKAIAQVFESDGAILYAENASARQYEAVAGWPWAPDDLPGLEPVSREHECIAALRDRNWVIDLREYHELPGFYQNLKLPDALLKLQGYRIIAPLLQSESLAGFVLLREPPPPFALTYEDRDLLLTLGRHVAVILAQQDSERRLAESRQFEAYHRFTAFLMHDLKNLVAQLDLVVSNAARHRNNPEFVDDAFATVANAATRMTHLIGQLRRGEAQDLRVPVPLQEVLQEVARDCGDRAPGPTLDSRLEGAATALVMADRARLTGTFEHVVRNAQDASRPTDPLTITLRVVDATAVVQVRDHGSGMTPEFIRDRLFRPFVSTKGAKGMGIGAYQVQEYVLSLGGDVEVESNSGVGTLFTIRLPLHE